MFEAHWIDIIIFPFHRLQLLILHLKCHTNSAHFVRFIPAVDVSKMQTRKKTSNSLWDLLLVHWTVNEARQFESHRIISPSLSFSIDKIESITTFISKDWIAKVFSQRNIYVCHVNAPTSRCVDSWMSLNSLAQVQVHSTCLSTSHTKGTTTAKEEDYYSSSAAPDLNLLVRKHFMDENFVNRKVRMFCVFPSFLTIHWRWEQENKRH